MSRSLGVGGKGACVSPLALPQCTSDVSSDPAGPMRLPPPPAAPEPPALPGRAVLGAGVPRSGGGAARNVSSCRCRPLPHSCQNALEEIHSHLPEQGSPRRDVTPRRRTMAPPLRTSRHVPTPPLQPPAHPRSPGPSLLVSQAGRFVCWV